MIELDNPNGVPSITWTLLIASITCLVIAFVITVVAPRNKNQDSPSYWKIRSPWMVVTRTVLMIAFVILMIASLTSMSAGNRNMDIISQLRESSGLSTLSCPDFTAYDENGVFTCTYQSNGEVHGAKAYMNDGKISLYAGDGTNITEGLTPGDKFGA